LTFSLSSLPHSCCVTSSSHHAFISSWQGNANLCRKELLLSNKFTPGLFTLLCRHGICHGIALLEVTCSPRLSAGFSFMSEHESPRTPFDLFYHRFKKPPKMVVNDTAIPLLWRSFHCCGMQVYDNGCHFHRYCLNREPRFFMNTRVHIDDLHCKQGR